jgi:hypothetical protein
VPHLVAQRLHLSLTICYFVTELYLSSAYTIADAVRSDLYSIWISNRTSALSRLTRPKAEVIQHSKPSVPFSIAPFDMTSARLLTLARLIVRNL